MKNTQKQLNNKASLTAEERAAMKHEFVSFMRANPVPEKGRSGTRSPYFPRMVRLPAFIIGLLVIMGGTSYAAENSLPNDFLYPVKTEILEPLFIQAPARTPLAKAEASQELVERRLDEAEALIDQNELDAESALGIVAAVNEHTDSVQTFVAGARQSGELSSALNVGSDMESILEAHGQVLEAIAEDSTATEAVEDLIEGIADQADEVEATGDAIEEQASETSPIETDEYIQSTATETQTAMASLRSSLEEFAGQNEELVTEAMSLLTKSESAYEAGTSYLELEQKEAALPQFRDALQFAQQGLILIESHEELSNNESI